MLENDLTGTKIGKLTIIGRGYNTPKILTWACRCECGNICYNTRQHLFDRTVKSCGCLKAQTRGNKHKNWKGIGRISSTIYARWRGLAKRRKIQFLVSLQYLSDLFEKQNYKCALSGLDINLPQTFKEYRNRKQFTASLDRKDCSKGYIEGNVQWVNKNVNMMKQQLSDCEFIEICSIITKFNNKYE